jgi:hypothetical protein
LQAHNIYSISHKLPNKPLGSNSLVFNDIQNGALWDSND